MKYSIQETGNKVSPYKLFRHDEYAGVPNNAELEFWMRIQQLERVVAHWKANHDEQLRVKRMLLDRPDLQDRALSIQKLEAENKELRAKLNNPHRGSFFDEFLASLEPKTTTQLEPLADSSD